MNCMDLYPKKIKNNIPKEIKKIPIISFLCTFSLKKIVETRKLNKNST